MKAAKYIDDSTDEKINGESTINNILARSPVKNQPSGNRKLTKAMSMPLFYSNERKTPPKGTLEQNNDKIAVCASVPNSQNVSFTNANLSRDGSNLFVNKLPTNPGTYIDQYSMGQWSGRYCKCRENKIQGELPKDKDNDKSEHHPKEENKADDLDSYISDYSITLGSDVYNEILKPKDKVTEGQGIICGLYCQNTAPEVQRNIIANILKQHYKKKPFIYSEAILGNTGECGDEKVIINARWWRNWCDYVNFESLFEHPNFSSKTSPTSSSKEKDYTTERSCEGYKLITKSSNKNAPETPRESCTYTKPRIIKNKILIDLEDSTYYKHKLKSNLQEIHDYITLPIAAWIYLSSWYSYDFCISKELFQSITDSEK